MKWIHISKELPIENKDVLCFCEHGNEFFIGYLHTNEDNEIYWYDSRNEERNQYVTHWMNLSKPSDWITVIMDPPYITNDQVINNLYR